jgi:hypothetical protein
MYARWLRDIFEGNGASSSAKRWNWVALLRKFMSGSTNIICICWVNCVFGGFKNYCCIRGGSIVFLVGPKFLLYFWWVTEPSLATRARRNDW